MNHITCMLCTSVNKLFDFIAMTACAVLHHMSTKRYTICAYNGSPLGISPINYSLNTVTSIFRETTIDLFTMYISMVHTVTLPCMDLLRQNLHGPPWQLALKR